MALNRLVWLKCRILKVTSTVRIIYNLIYSLIIAFNKIEVIVE